jgi:hypothetical protein
VIPLDVDVLAGATARTALDLNTDDDAITAIAENAAYLLVAGRAGSHDVVCDAITLTYAVTDSQRGWSGFAH